MFFVCINIKRLSLDLWRYLNVRFIIMTCVCTRAARSRPVATSAWWTNQPTTTVTGRQHRSSWQPVPSVAPWAPLVAGRAVAPTWATSATNSSEASGRSSTSRSPRRGRRPRRSRRPNVRPVPQASRDQLSKNTIPIVRSPRRSGRFCWC